MLRCVSRCVSPLVVLPVATQTTPLRWASTGAGSDAIIYRSKYPSIKATADKYPTLYGYMREIWDTTTPERVCLRQAETGQKFVFGEMTSVTHKMAQVLYHEAGVRKGDTVTIAMLNNVIFAPLSYGILELGATISTVNAVSTPDTLAFYLKATNSKVLLAMKFFQKNAEQAVEIVHKETGREVKIMYPEHFLSMSGQEPIPADYKPLDGASHSDTIFIPFSSGSTGMPKGVQLTNGNLVSNLIQASSLVRLKEGMTTVSVLPFFHIYGFTNVLNTIMGQKCSQIVMMKYNATTFVDTLEREKIGFCLVAPPILVSLLKNKEKLREKDLSHLTGLRSSSAPLSVELEKQCEEAFGCSVGQGYGMTEMSPCVVVLPTGFDAKTRVHGSSGMLAPDTEMRVVKIDDNQQSGADQSAGVDAKPGQDGEIWVRGPQMMKGYLNAKDNETAFVNGWYRTGDIGHYDEEAGYLSITDRLKELIKYKGFQVSPAALEGVLLQHPWVQDCIVIGVPDPRDVSFENPRALVVLKKNLKKQERIRASDELLRFVMQECPPEKRLHGGVRIVPALERNAAGKIMRRQIRQAEIAYLKGVADGTIDPGEAPLGERMRAAIQDSGKTGAMMATYAKIAWHIQKEKAKNMMPSGNKQ